MLYLFPEYKNYGPPPYLIAHTRYGRRLSDTPFTENGVYQ